MAAIEEFIEGPKATPTRMIDKRVKKPQPFIDEKGGW